MRRSRWWIAVAVVAGFPGGLAHAAEPPGLPALRVAGAADHAGRPDALREWWTLRLLDPRSDAMLELRFLRDGDLGSGLRLVHRPRGGTQEDPVRIVVDGPVTAPGRRLTVSGPQGRASGVVGPGGATFDVAAADVTGRVRLDRVRRGPAALRARLGPDVINGGDPGAWLSWAMPIARSRARGTITVGGEAIRVDGWRATYEHWWGRIALWWGVYDYWDTWTVHRRGATWVAFGLNRPDTITGAGARDAMWLGVLARAGAGGTLVCRPRIHRSKWLLGGSFGIIPVAAGRLSARCGRLRATFTADEEQRVIEPYLAEWEDIHSPARVNGHGDGWVLQRAN